MVDVVFEGFFDVGIAEVVVIFHRSDGTAAWAVDAGEAAESKSNVPRRQCFAMVPLAYDIGYVLNWVFLSGQYHLHRKLARKGVVAASGFARLQCGQAVPERFAATKELSHRSARCTSRPREGFEADLSELCSVTESLP